MHAALEAIQNSWLSQTITSERWLITLHGKQILETLHFLAFSLQIGAIMVISIRLLGLGRGISIAPLERPVFCMVWSCFVVVFVTGVLQFIPIAAEVFYRPSFRAKIVILIIALVSFVSLQGRVRRGAVAWDAGATVPGSSRALAAFSILLWPTVIVVARLMYAFVQMAAG